MQHAVTTVTFDMQPGAALANVYCLRIEEDGLEVDKYERSGPSMKYVGSLDGSELTVSGARKLFTELQSLGVRGVIDDGVCDLYLWGGDEPVVSIGTVLDASLCVMSGYVTTVFILDGEKPNVETWMLDANGNLAE